jgi:hypothetical protein
MPIPLRVLIRFRYRRLSDAEIEDVDDLYLDILYGLPTGPQCLTTCRAGTYNAATADYPSTCTACPGGKSSNVGAICNTYGGTVGPLTQACYAPTYPDAYVATPPPFGPAFPEVQGLAMLPGGKVAVLNLEAVVVLDATTGAVVSNTTDTLLTQLSHIAANADTIYVLKPGAAYRIALNGTLLGAVTGMPGGINPRGLAVDNAGNLYIPLEVGGNGIVVVRPDGTFTQYNNTVLGTGGTSLYASSLAVTPDGATLYAADNFQQTGRVMWRIDTATWTATLLSGRDPRTASTVNVPLLVDGAAAAVAWSYMYSLQLVGTTLYFSDYTNLLIRTMSTVDGSVTTLLKFGDLQYGSPSGATALAVVSPLRMLATTWGNSTVRSRVYAISVTLPPPSPPPLPPAPPPPVSSPAAACWDVAHRFSAAPSDWRGLYPDAGAAQSQWSAVSLRAPSDALLSENDYGLVHPLLGTGSVPLPGGELYDVARDGWLLSGTNGLGVILPTSSEAIGNATRGLSFAIWFLASNTWSAVNEGNNVLLAASTQAGLSLRLAFSAGQLPVNPRISLKVSRLSPGAHISSTSSDYANSDRDFGAAPAAANPDGNATWPVRLGTTWQHVVITFAGSGALRSLHWNGCVPLKRLSRPSCVI